MSRHIRAEALEQDSLMHDPLAVGTIPPTSGKRASCRSIFFVAWFDEHADIAKRKNPLVKKTFLHQGLDQRADIRLQS